MTKKYGGVDNKKGLEDVQEAYIVGAPTEPAPKRSIGSIIASWIVFVCITYIILELLLIATGVFENQKIPTWAKLTIPLLPTLIRVVIVVANYLQSKHRTKNTSC